MLTIDEMVEGSVVPCIGSAVVLSEIGSFSRGARPNGEATGEMSSSTPLRDCSSTGCGIARSRFDVGGEASYSVAGGMIDGMESW